MRYSPRQTNPGTAPEQLACSEGRELFPEPVAGVASGADAERQCRTRIRETSTSRRASVARGWPRERVADCRKARPPGHVETPASRTRIPVRDDVQTATSTATPRRKDADEPPACPAHLRLNRLIRDPLRGPFGVVRNAPCARCPAPGAARYRYGAGQRSATPAQGALRQIAVAPVGVGTRTPHPVGRLVPRTPTRTLRRMSATSFTGP